MPSWGNTDANTAKPHFPEHRQVRLFAALTTNNSTSSGATSITFVQNAQALGITSGMYIYGGGAGVVAGTGQRDFFKGNNTVSTVTGNLVTLSAATTATVAQGTTLTFDTTIIYNGSSNNANNYFADTILVTAGRLANTQGTTYAGGSNVANTQLGNGNVGWNLYRFKVNNDGTKRILKETLIALANPVASNVSSANTSSNSVFGGL
jgi:hypothetical protein